MIIDFEAGYEPESSGPRRKVKGPLALSGLIVLGALFLSNTFAANISLSGSSKVEFGQGVQVVAACSGSNTLTLTPNSAFVNSTGNGAYYLNSIKISGIPSSCQGVDFNLSAYDSTTSTALPIFGSTKTVAAVWNDAGTFKVGAGSSGMTITSGSGTFTITFTSPVALASSVSRISLQSTSHAAYSCALDGICAVGDAGPGGGTVYYVSVNAFSAPGSACDTNCHGLEVANSSWRTGSPQNDSQGYTLSGTQVTLPAQDFSTSFGTQVGTYRGAAEKNNWFIGQGFINTKLIAELSGNTTSNSAAVRARAFSPIGYSWTAGQWFIPSFNELNELCKYANGQITGDPSRQCMGNTPFNTANTSTAEGFTGSVNYFSSSVNGSAGAVQTSVIYFGNGESNSSASIFNDTRGFRPVRVF
jgi:hypothetical protein